MTSSVKMPSSVVPIDVSGQSFSRMASFRRSLIHVDFFLRRKKKDKRRNTVTEGDTKELRNALQNIINEEHKIAPNGTLPQQFISNGAFNPTVENNRIKKETLQETNNNFPKNIAVIKDCTEKESLKRNCCLEKEIPLQNNNMKIEPKTSDQLKSYINKRKPKSHIPISTISAAMNVAVEMRQLNGKEDHSSSSNWSYSSDHNSSDSDNRKTGDKEKELDLSTNNGEDSGFSDHFQNRVKGNSKVFNSKVILKNEETEALSSESSENNTMQDDESSNATSLESDAFLMSSDESDEDSSDLLLQKYGSLTSFTTMSEGSLNSLLSQNGIEMTSSTGTLTSIGQERFPTPPPPPPPFVMVAPKKESVKDTIPVLTKTNTKILTKNETSSKASKKLISPKKSKKPDKHNRLEYSKESNMSIFTSLVNKKSRTKERKNTSVSTKSTMTRPSFDMYGNNSPQKTDHSSIFIKENLHHISKTEPISYLQSFLPDNNKKINAEIDSKTKESYANREETSIEASSPSVNSNSDNLIEKNDIELPHKYAHHVVVTPIARQDENTKYNCRRSLYLDSKVIKPEKNYENTLQSYDHNQSKNRMSQNSNVLQKPQRPKTLQSEPKTAARVVLDPEGRVIYSTNSLDRRFPHEYLNQYSSYESKNEKCRPFYSPINVPENAKTNLTSPMGSSPQNSYQQKKNEYPYCDKSTGKVRNFNGFTTGLHSKTNDNPNMPAILLNNSNPSHHTNIHCSINDSENTALINESKLKSPNSTKPRNSFKTPPSYEEAVGRHCSHTSIADPNVSGLPKVKTMLTEENINLHLENIEKLNKMHLETIANSYKSLMTPHTDSPSSPLDGNLGKLQKSNMSTEDLFAVIHDCKKRMNIKTDSDLSLCSSSRSSSPPYFRSNQSKGILAETGFLTPRNLSNFNDCRNRRSWADFRPTSSSPNERKSLASDRLGRTKPTSMHDFKMLLLQARSNTQISGPRKSAVEMLKISQSPKSPNGEVLTSPNSYYTQSFSVQSSPTSPSYIHSGHSTVPFKRHNRVRSSLQSRYTMYPPIFEDCSEEAEIKSENVTKLFT